MNQPNRVARRLPNSSWADMLERSFVLAYMGLIGGIAGWMGSHEFWNWKSVAIVMISPIVFGFLLSAIKLRQGRIPILVYLHWFAFPIFSGIIMGSFGLALAWLITETTENWENAFLRAVVGAAMPLICGFLMWKFFKNRSRSVEMAPAPIAKDDNG